jgi:polysaccharide deacetylase family protein (PEP-CTERM system associated)
VKALTVDIEDYHSLVARNKLGVEVPVSGDVDMETEHLLDLLDDLDVRATCFVVGRVAQERPHLVKMIATRGHEIASHGFQHLLMHQLDPRSFAEDLRASIQVLEGITGVAVRGFRAPAFSLRERQRWAFEIMAEEGIEYDSSVRLVLPFGRRVGQSLIDAASACGIREFPGLALGWGRCRVPLEGGGGLRLVPEFISRWGVNRVRRAGFSVPVYIHPYDLTTKSRGEWPTADWSKRIRLAWFDWFQHRGRSRVAPRLHRMVSRRRSEDDLASFRLSIRPLR